MAESRKVKRLEGDKPDSFDSRIRTLDEGLRQLCEAVLEVSAPQRRVRVLAILAALGHDGQSEMFESSDGE